MAKNYGFDISVPATNAKEAVQWLYFAYLAAVKEQNGAAMSLGRVSTFLDIYFERDLKEGTLTESQAQEIIDDFVIKLRIVRFLRTPEYDDLFAGDPTWVTESIGGMGDDGRSLVTKSSFRFLHTLYNLGPAPEPNLTIWYSPRLPDNFRKFAAKVAIDTSAVQFENDEARANVLNAIGTAYRMLSKSDEALRYYQQSLDIKRRIGEKRGTGLTLGEMAVELLAHAPPRFTLIGLSLGGYLAFEVIRRQRERIERLVLLDTRAVADTETVRQGRLADIATVQAGGIDALIPELPTRWVHPSNRARVGDLMGSMARSIGDRGQLLQNHRRQCLTTSTGLLINSAEQGTSDDQTGFSDHRGRPSPGDRGGSWRRSSVRRSGRDKGRAGRSDRNRRRLRRSRATAARNNDRAA